MEVEKLVDNLRKMSDEDFLDYFKEKIFESDETGKREIDDEITKIFKEISEFKDIVERVYDLVLKCDRK